MKVPFVDLDAQYQTIKDEIQDAIISVLESKKFIQGELAENFCNHFLQVHGGNHATGCSNGTSAITVALKALNIGPGDEVITVTNTFFATVEAIHECGADIVLVDCDPKTYTIDTKQIESKITPKTKAIIAVHLYGNPADMKTIHRIAQEHNLMILEDCAQGHLAQIDNIAVGSTADAATFSFYPGKNLGAYGDAGLILTKSSEIHKKVEMHVNHGRLNKYEHEFLAGNYRMDGMQAAILDVKCKYIQGWTDQRIAAANYYDQKLKSHGFKVIEKLPNSECVYHLYIVEVSNRDEVMDYLKQQGVSTGIHYPIPMHLQPALKHLNYKEGDFPVSECSANKIISLPMFAEITKEQQDYVIESFLKVAKND